MLLVGAPAGRRPRFPPNRMRTWVPMDPPTIYVAQDPRGLWLPPSVRGLPQVRDPRLQRSLPRELRPEPRFQAVQRGVSDDEVPEGQDFLYAAPTPADLDLPDPKLEDAVDLLSEVPFLPAMQALSVLSAAVYHAHTNLDSQRHLASAFYSGEIREKVLAFLNGERHRLAFDPRQITALQRLVVRHAADIDPGHGSDTTHQWWLAAALLAVAGALPDAEPPDVPEHDPADMEAWSRYLVQVGLYYERPWIAETMARAWSQYVTVADDLRDRPTSCPIDEWLREDLGFTLAGQVAVGLAYGHGSGAFDPTLSIEERAGRRPGSGFLAGTAMAEREKDAVHLISADRDELLALFEQQDDPMHLAWDHTAFEAKPFLRAPDGRLVLHSPAALMSWMTRGVHYRALDAANRRRDAKGRKAGSRWLGYAGALGEESVRRLLFGSIPEGAHVPAYVYGEIEFRGLGGRQDSPDAAIQSGPDLALIEVYSGRFSREARASGDTEPMRKALRRATVGKLKEVLDRADDVLEGRLVYPDTPAAPKTIWPVIVHAGDSVAPTPMLWSWLREDMEGRIGADPRIRQPVIMDLDDLEPLLGLVERGNSIFNLLGRFLASNLAELPLCNWLARDFGMSEPLRPAYVDEQWTLAARAGAAVLYPHSERLTRAIGASA